SVDLVEQIGVTLVAATDAQHDRFAVGCLRQIRGCNATLEIEASASEAGTEFRFHLTARSFLHNQVRSFVGTLERVGSGGWAPDDVKAALAACDRAACGPVSPPQGLYMTGVGYPEDPFANCG
ncbi:hypothetical protein LCGC14_2602330, partial [marine sediment metagenome]